MDLSKLNRRWALIVGLVPVQVTFPDLDGAPTITGRAAETGPSISFLKNGSNEEETFDFYMATETNFRPVNGTRADLTLNGELFNTYVQHVGDAVPGSNFFRVTVFRRTLNP